MLIFVIVWFRSKKDSIKVNPKVTWVVWLICMTFKPIKVWCSIQSAIVCEPILLFHWTFIEKRAPIEHLFRHQMAQTKKLSVSPAKTAPKASRFRRILAQVRSKWSAIYVHFARFSVIIGRVVTWFKSIDSVTSR